MERHGDVTVDFSVFGGGMKHVRIPFHQTVRVLIEELAIIYGFEEDQKSGRYQSFKALITEQFISGNQTLLDVNIKDGEILIIQK